MPTVACEFPACPATTDYDDNHCSGCEKTVCSLHPDAPFGPHDVDDHRECSVCGEAGHFDGECDE